jgi:hypothetical protein
LRQWYKQGQLAAEVVDEAIVIRPSFEEYQSGETIWAYFPQAQSEWLKGIVEWVRGNTVRVVSGLFGVFIESPEAIAPGDWELII